MEKEKEEEQEEQDVLPQLVSVETLTQNMQSFQKSGKTIEVGEGKD